MNETMQVFGPRSVETGEPLASGMDQLYLTGRVLPVGARLVARHVFTSAEEQPLEAIYCFGLPRDAALRRFHIEGEGFSVKSDLQPVKKAVETYEEGMERGSLAGLARAYQDGLVNLTLGNIRPGETVTVLLEIAAGVELRDDGYRFRFPFTLAPCYHQDMRASVVEPGVGEMQLPPEFGDLVLPRWKADASKLHAVGFSLEVALPGGVNRVSSLSHHLDTRHGADGRCTVSLARESDVPNRDVVIDVGGEGALEGLFLGDDPDGGRRFAAVIPSTRFGAVEREGDGRRIVFTMDRSGSMGREPMAQAKRALLACLGALGENDQFGIVAFDSVTEVMSPSLIPSSDADRARTWLDNVDARGGTELHLGVEAALRVLGEAGGDILLLTDGQVFGGDAIIASLRGRGVRVHTLGIGSAARDRFLAQFSEQTGGVSRWVGEDERIDAVALELFAAAGHPVAANLTAEGNDATTLAPEAPAAVFRDHPLVLRGHVKGDVPRVRLAWEGAEDRAFELAELPRFDVCGTTLKLAQGAVLTTRAEVQPEAKELKRLADEYGLANQEMALVAVVERADDQPGELPRTMVVPVGMPKGMALDSYFAPSPMAARSIRFSMNHYEDMDGDMGGVCASMAPASAVERALLRPVEPSPRKRPADSAGSASARPPRRWDQVDDLLLDLSSELTPEGCMPGDTEDTRLLRTLVARSIFESEGYTADHGVFAEHIRKMDMWCARQDLTKLDPEHQRVIRALTGFSWGSPRGSRLAGTPQDDFAQHRWLAPDSRFPWGEAGDLLNRTP